MHNSKELFPYDYRCQFDNSNGDRQSVKGICVVPYSPLTLLQASTVFINRKRDRIPEAE